MEPRVHICSIKESGQHFDHTVVRYAKKYNMGRFRVFLNNRELLPSQSPLTIDKGQFIEIAHLSHFEDFED